MIRIFFTIVFLWIYTLLPAQVIYINSAATGSNNGASWSNAYTNLQTALSNAAPGNQLWVATGTYKPAPPNYPDSSFNLKNGIEIYGGFNGSETTLNQRNHQTNITILSGDIDNNDLTSPAGAVTDIVGYNSKHIFRIKKIDASALIDGFTFTAGCANDTIPTEGGGAINIDTSYMQIINCTFQANKTHGSLGGGAIHNMGGSPKFINCRFINNRAGGVGGAFKTKYGNPVFTGCLFLNNKNLYSGGGAIQESSAAIELNNCTFIGNDSIALRNNASHPIVKNCIFWDNIGGEIVDEGTSSSTVSYSLVNGGFTGPGNINTDPLFADPSAGNFQLSTGSPAVDAGSTDTSGLFLPGFDLNGNVRLTGTAIDIGAFEYQLSSAISSPQKDEILFSVYPNPTNHNITCDVSIGAYTDISVEIKDLTGRTIHSENFPRLSPGMHSIPIELTDISCGIYSIAVKTSNLITSNQKLVIQ